MMGPLDCGAGHRHPRAGWMVPVLFHTTRAWLLQGERAWACPRRSHPFARRKSDSGKQEAHRHSDGGGGSVCWNASALMCIDGRSFCP